MAGKPAPEYLKNIAKTFLRYANASAETGADGREKQVLANTKF